MAMSETVATAAPSTSAPAPPATTPSAPAAPPPNRPPQSSIFSPQWPGPGSTAPGAAILAAVVAGLVAAASVPWGRTGIGWLITAVVAVGATAVVSRRGRTGPSGRGTRSWIPASWAALGLALVAVGTVRASAWLFALCLLAACLALAQAAGGGPTATGLVAAVAALFLGAVRALPWAGRGLVSVRTRTRGSVGRTVVAALVGLALVTVFGALFATADAAFNRIVVAIVPTVDAVRAQQWTTLFVL